MTDCQGQKPVKENVVESKSHVAVEDLPFLSDRQRWMAERWIALQVSLDEGKFGDEMDAFFHHDFTYGNPSRPDLGTYAQWKVSPMELYRRLSPMRYTTLDIAGRGEDTIWVHCHHTGVHSSGRYMGKEASGAEFAIEWFSTVRFEGDQIIRIFSIADVLSMLIQLGVIDKALLPVDPYR